MIPKKWKVIYGELNAEDTLNVEREFRNYAEMQNFIHGYLSQSSNVNVYFAGPIHMSTKSAK